MFKIFFMDLSLSSMVKYNLPDCKFFSAATAHTSNQWTNAEDISIILSNEKEAVRFLNL